MKNSGFMIAGSVMTMCFLIVVNFLTSPNELWFIYPCFVLLLGPIGLLYAKRGKYKQLSITYCALIITFLVIENVIDSPTYPWVLYIIFPLLWWPILAQLGNRAKTMTTALVGSSSIALYYIILNQFLSSQYPWAIYPVFVVIWWPLVLYHVQKKTYFQFSVQATFIISVFFISVNAVSTPNTIWAVYPIFCVLWWPLSMYYFVYKRI